MLFVVGKSAVKIKKTNVPAYASEGYQTSLGSNFNLKMFFGEYMTLPRGSMGWVDFLKTKVKPINIFEISSLLCTNYLIKIYCLL